jgi:hypothetical protein
MEREKEMRMSERTHRRLVRLLDGANDGGK